MTTSPTIEKIAPAFLKAQKEIESVFKENTAKIPTKSGGQYQYKYADLGAVIEACKKPLNDNGISVLQPVNGNSVETRLVHESGEWMADGGVNIINARPDDPQAQGSAITYARRYGLQSMVFIPAEDDDGEGAMNRTAQPKPVQDPIMEVTNTGKCPECGATGKYHAPTCSRK